MHTDIQQSIRRIGGAVALATLLLADTTAMAEETITVMGWARNFDHLRPGWDRIVENFEALHPGVKVKTVDTAWEQTLQQATNAVLSGNLPDIVQAPAIWVTQLHQIGGLAAMDEVFGDAEMSKFPSSSSVTHDGHVRAALWLPGPVLLVYNRNLLVAAGLDPDSPPNTWPEFTKAIKAVCALPPKDGGKVYGIALRTARSPNSPQWALPVVFGHGGWITDEAGKVDVTNDGFAKGYEWFRDIIRGGCAAEGSTNNDTRNLFAQGRAGFIFEGPWARGLVKGISGGKLSVAPDGDVWAAAMPAGADGQVRQIANHQTLVIFEKSKNTELAAEFVRFALTDPRSVDFMYSSSGNIPTGKMDVLRVGAVARDDWSQVFISTLPYSIPVPIRHAKSNAVFDTLAPVLQDVIQGADAREALQKAQRDIDRLLSR